METQTNLISKEMWRMIDDRVRQLDEDRWLSSRFAPLPQRNWLVALYAFDNELSRVQHIVSEQALGQIRFQWWRETLFGIYDWIVGGPSPRAHDVTGALAESVCSSGIARIWLDAMIDAHESAFLNETDIGDAHAACLNASIVLLDPTSEMRFSEVTNTRREIPEPIRPALAYLSLRSLYQSTDRPGPLSKRWRLLKTVATGRLN